MVQTHGKQKKHLTQAERIEISVRYREGRSWRKIARKMWRCHTVINREIRRNGKDPWWWDRRKYKAQDAEYNRLERRYKANYQHNILIRDRYLRETLFRELRERGHYCGIDEILWERRKLGLKVVSTTTLYNFIWNYKPERTKYLRYGKHRYKKRKGRLKKTALVWVPLISERPQEINNRTSFGHWEADMVVWPQGEKWGLVTLVERKTRYMLTRKVHRATAVAVYAAMYTMLYDQPVRSITSDNGSEFAKLASLGKKLSCEVYRCHPYASREKGTNEVTNKAIRRFCKKGLSIQSYTESSIQKIQDMINAKPRKMLGYATAHHAYHSLLLTHSS